VRRFDAPNTEYWKFNTLDARGNVLTEELGNGVKVTSGFNALTGLLESRQSGVGGGTGIQNLAYQWSNNGNLTRREDKRQGLTEVFTYDALERLDVTTLNSTPTNDVDYSANRGYYKGPELLKCEDAGIKALVPKPLTSNSKADGRFDKRDFVYNSAADEYRCPAGERATWRFSTVEDDMTLHKYWSSACPTCLLRSACTTSKYRRIGRWEREEVFDRVQQRLDQMPEAGRIRRQTVEHAFGTLKAWMGATHFLTKTLPRVRTEMSLHVLAYNLKRVVQIMGVRPLIQAIRAS